MFVGLFAITVLEKVFDDFFVTCCKGTREVSRLSCKCVLSMSVNLSMFSNQPFFFSSTCSRRGTLGIIVTVFHRPDGVVVTKKINERNLSM